MDGWVALDRVEATLFSKTEDWMRLDGRGWMGRRERWELRKPRKKPTWTISKRRKPMQLSIKKRKRKKKRTHIVIREQLKSSLVFIFFQ